MSDPQDQAINAALDHWIEAELRIAIPAMQACISATGLTRARPDFNETMTPVRGSVVASPITDSADRPDYFYHWARDSAIVIGALNDADARGWVEVGADVFVDFVRFSLRLTELTGVDVVARHELGKTDMPALQMYLRGPEEMMTLVGDRVTGEARFNPDGTLDLLKWSSPQFDGPALRALTLMRILARMPDLDKTAGGDAMRLLTHDLGVIFRHRDEPCFDLWEERFGHHYHTRVVTLSALVRGAELMRRQRRGQDHADEAANFAQAAAELIPLADHHWTGQGSQKGVAHIGYYAASIRSHAHVSKVPAPMRDLDAAVILAVCNAGLQAGRHSAIDPRVHATLHRLELLFEHAFPVNTRIAPKGPLLGRFEGDGYYGGGIMLMTTLAAAQVSYAAALRIAHGADLPCDADNIPFLTRILGASDGLSEGILLPTGRIERRPLALAFFNHGDQILGGLQRLMPQGGRLPEQLDRVTGAPRSVRDLAWSHAAFITAAAARARVLDALKEKP